MKSLRVLLLAIMLNPMFFIYQAKAYDPTGDLQSAFCNDIGPFSMAASRHARELISIIENMKHDPACAGMFEQTRYYLNDLMQFQNDYYSQFNDNRIQARVEYIENEIQVERAKILRNELADYIASNPYATIEEIQAEAVSRGINPYSDVLYGLESELANSKIKLFKHQIDNDRDISLRSQTSRYGKIQGLQRGIDSLFTLLNTSNHCSENNQNLFSKMGAQVLGAAGSIYGGVVGSALIAGGTFLNGLSEYVRGLKYKTKIEELEAPSLSMAVGCSMEGMAKLYCQARDTSDVLKFTIGDTQGECPDCTEFFKGIDLIGRQVLVFNKWITKVITGSSPSSGSQASERIEAFDLRFKLTSSKEKIYGKIGEVRTLITQVTGEGSERRKNEFKLGLMDSLFWFINSAGGCSSEMGCSVSSSTNPFKNSFSVDSKCGPLVYIYSNGTSRISQFSDSDGGDCKRYVSRVYPDTYLELEDQLELMEDLFLEAEEYVSLRIQSVFEENPMKILARFEFSDPVIGNSPKEFLYEMQKYLDYLIIKYYQEEHPYFIGLVKTMKLRVDKTLRIVSTKLCNLNQNGSINREGLKPGESCYSPASQVTDIGNELAPRQETRSIESALREIVTRDIDLKLESGLAPKYLRYLRQVSKERSVNFFVKNYLQFHEVLKDTAQAKVITRQNIDSVSNLFAKKYLEYLKKMREDLDNDPLDEEGKEVFAQLCFQALHSANESDLFKGGGFANRISIQKLCKKVRYISYVPSKVPHLNFDQLVETKQRKRICELYDFKNKLEIYQITREETQFEEENDIDGIQSERLPKKPYAVIID